MADMCATVCNELLCFVQNKLSSLPADLIIQLCADFYDPLEIVKAKDVLFNVLPSYARRVKKRTEKGGSKPRQVLDMRDLVERWQAADHDGESLPRFTAARLENIPSCVDSYTGISSLVKEIVTLKRRLDEARLDDLHVAVASLSVSLEKGQKRREANELEIGVCGTADATVVMVSVHTQTADCVASASFEDLGFNGDVLASEGISEESLAQQEAVSLPDNLVKDLNTGPKAQYFSFADALASVPSVSVTPSHNSVRSGETIHLSESHDRSVRVDGGSRDHAKSDSGFIVHESRKNRRRKPKSYVIGSDKSSAVITGVPKLDYRDVFIGRCVPSTTPKGLSDFVTSLGVEVKECVVVSSGRFFNSFRLRISNRHWGHIVKAGWGDGVVVGSYAPARHPSLVNAATTVTVSKPTSESNVET